MESVGWFVILLDSEFHEDTVYLEHKSEEMHLSGQMAEHRCWHGDYYGGVQNGRGKGNKIIYNFIQSCYITYGKAYGLVKWGHESWTIARYSPSPTVWHIF